MTSKVWIRQVSRSLMDTIRFLFEVIYFSLVVT